MNRSRARIYAALAAAFVTFAIWGSLFPFDFHRVPVTAAAALFWSAWQSDPLTWSLTDLVSNVLLFVPIGLFVAAAVEKTWPKWGGSGTAVLGVFTALVVLSTAIELGQAFVSWRTPSVIDVLAEAIGGAAGLLIWRALGTEIDALVRGADQVVRRSTAAERALLMYAAVFALAWLLPFDFTLRPVEIADKYAHKRLLLPFTPSPDAATSRQLALTFASAIPIGLAAALCGCGPGVRRSVALAAVVAGVSLVVLELGQALVFSRTTDATALLAALAGAGIGAAAARMAPKPAITPFDFRTLGAAGPVVVVMAVAMIVEWWPFDLSLDPDRARFQAIAWSLAPFRPPSGFLDVLPGVILAVVAGAIIRVRLRPEFLRLQLLLVVLFAGAVCLIVEIGRVVLIGGRPTLVSVLIKVGALALGLAAPWFPASRLERRFG